MRNIPANICGPYYLPYMILIVCLCHHMCFNVSCLGTCLTSLSLSHFFLSVSHFLSLSFSLSLSLSLSLSRYLSHFLSLSFFLLISLTFSLSLSSSYLLSDPKYISRYATLNSRCNHTFHQAELFWWDISDIAQDIGRIVLVCIPIYCLSGGPDRIGRNWAHCRPSA